MKEAAGPDEQELAQEMADAFLNEDLPENIFGAPKAGPGMWASTIRIMDPIEGKTMFLHRFEQNEAAVRYVSSVKINILIPILFSYRRFIFFQPRILQI